jgi:hypothetical protein
MKIIIISLVSLLLALGNPLYGGETVFSPSKKEKLLEESIQFQFAIKDHEKRINFSSAVTSIVGYYMRKSGIKSDSPIVTEEAFKAMSGKTVKELNDLADQLIKEENLRLFGEH